MSSLPADIINQSLDAAGVDFTIGDPEEGTREAQVSLRAYGQCLRQLLRAANWDFARKTAPLVLLADATGGTPDVGTLVPVPWVYEYQYPIDCMKARYIPWNPAQQTAGIPPGNIQIPTAPLTTGLGQPLTGQRIRPARFVISTDPNYAPPPGQLTWDVQGASPTGPTVVLTDVKSAQLVYTAFMPYPSTWDSMFRAAMVGYLASEIALPLAKDKKFGMSLRAQNIAVAKEKIAQARLTDGNEGWYTSDIPVDWMVVRSIGGGRGGGWGDSPGIGSGHGWDSCSFSDGSAY